MPTIVMLVDLFVLLVREFFGDVPIWVLISVWIISPPDLFSCYCLSDFRPLYSLNVFVLFVPLPSLTAATFFKLVIVHIKVSLVCQIFHSSHVKIVFSF